MLDTHKYSREEIATAERELWTQFEKERAQFITQNGMHSSRKNFQSWISWMREKAIEFQAEKNRREGRQKRG